MFTEHRAQSSRGPGRGVQDREASRRPGTGRGREVRRVTEAVPREEEGARGAFWLLEATETDQLYHKSLPFSGEKSFSLRKAAGKSRESTALAP